MFAVAGIPAFAFETVTAATSSFFTME